MARLDSSLENAGAEFLVLGHLLIEKMQAFKAYTNFPGYDIIATNAEKNVSCRIQVKSRWATDFDGGFLIKNFDCDFVVVVVLNRGYSKLKKSRSQDDTGRREPEFYVIPVEIVKAARYEKSSWGKVFLRHIEQVEQYLGNWDLIRQFLGGEETQIDAERTMDMD
ncbi:hypothetical protein FBR02_01850 [Anaerolineae bacterium CFX9]|nr:hypothetical protein [Anaerolineae bacterium CFX9]